MASAASAGARFVIQTYAQPALVEEFATMLSEAPLEAPAMAP